MALVPQFTTGTVADPITMNKLTDAVNTNTANKADKNNAEFTGTMTLNAKDVATTESGLIALLNGWAIHEKLTVQKVGDIVTITGMIKNGITALDTKVGTLPLGFRPPNNPHFIVGYDDGTVLKGVGEMAIVTDGSLIIKKNVASTYILMNIAYSV